jgi:hypothetical protein
MQGAGTHLVKCRRFLRGTLDGQFGFAWFGVRPEVQGLGPALMLAAARRLGPVTNEMDRSSSSRRLGRARIRSDPGTRASHPTRGQAPGARLGSRQFWRGTSAR